MTWKWEGLLCILRRDDGEIIATVRKAGLFWRWQRGERSGYVGSLMAAIEKAEVTK